MSGETIEGRFAGAIPAAAGCMPRRGHAPHGGDRPIPPEPGWRAAGGLQSHLHGQLYALGHLSLRFDPTTKSQRHQASATTEITESTENFD